MNLWMAAIAGLLLLAGATCLYAAMPHQRFMVSVPSPTAARIAGSACLAAALASLMMFMGLAAAIFTWAVWLMLAWTIPPVVIAWRSHMKGLK